MTDFEVGYLIGVKVINYRNRWFRCRLIFFVILPGKWGSQGKFRLGRRKIWCRRCSDKTFDCSTVPEQVSREKLWGEVVPHDRWGCAVDSRATGAHAALCHISGGFGVLVSHYV